MKTLGKYFLIGLLFIFLFSSCKEDEEEVVTGYLESSSEYTSLKSLAAADIRGYLEQLGQADFAAQAAFDVKIFKIEYKTAFEGDSIIASGIVAVPVSKKKKDVFPIMSFQHGVILSKYSAPSVDPLGDASALPAYIASTGIVVALPDYIGYGQSDLYDHPFMHKSYSANTVLDFIRAAKEFIATEKPCKTNGNLFLSGYGEGAMATLATVEKIESDSIRYDDLKVKASACGSGVYDLIRFREWLLTQVKFDQPWYIAYLLESYTKYSGLDIDYSLVFNEPFASKIPGMVDGIRTFDQMNDLFGTKSLSELLNDDFKDDVKFNSDTTAYAGLKNILIENSIPVWMLKTNVTLYYGKNDTWVPADQALNIYSEFKNYGVTSNLKINAMEGADHESGLSTMLVKSVSWFKSF
jgi:hypothetical protein